jgi:putative membrane protein
MKIHAFAVVAALALPALAYADKTNEKTTNTNPAAPATAKLAESDVKIVAHLHHVNQMEIDLGKAAQKSTNPAVKSYGDTLVKDHQANDKELTAFAKSRKLAVIPAAKPETDADKQDHKAMMEKVAKLKTLKGAEFDREFLSMMATDHDKELAKIDVAIGATTDTDLQSLLKATKPVLQRHADAARDLQSNPQASTTPTPAPTK